MRAALTPQAATELRTRRAELNTHIEAVAREAREAQVTLAQRNRTLANFDILFSGAAATLTGLFMPAGETELADRVRPTARRATRTEVGDGQSTTEEVSG